MSWRRQLVKAATEACNGHFSSSDQNSSRLEEEDESYIETEEGGFGRVMETDKLGPER